MRLLFFLLLALSFCSSQNHTEKYCLIGSVLKNGQFDEVVDIQAVDGSCGCSFTVDCREAKCSTIKNVFFQCDPTGTSSSYKTTGMNVLYNKTECKELNKTCRDNLFRNLHNEYKTLFWGLKPEERETLKETWRSGMYAIVRRDGGGTGKVESHDHTPWVLLAFGGVLVVASGIPLVYIMIIEKKKLKKEMKELASLETPDVSKETVEPPVKPLDFDTFYNTDKKKKIDDVDCE